MARSLTITYALHPPAGSSVDPLLDPNATHDFPLSLSATEGPSTKGYKTHYDDLRATIAEARAKTGDELTRWRDAIGTAEQKDSKLEEKEGEMEEDDTED